MDRHAFVVSIKAFSFNLCPLPCIVLWKRVFSTMNIHSYPKIWTISILFGRRIGHKYHGYGSFRLAFSNLGCKELFFCYIIALIVDIKNDAVNVSNQIELNAYAKPYVCHIYVKYNLVILLWSKTLNKDLNSKVSGTPLHCG